MSKLAQMPIASPGAGWPVLPSILVLSLICLLPAGSQAQQAPNSVAALQQAISELDGSYRPESIELYQSLARAQLDNNDYAGAAQAWQEALQALRVNEGLASETQLQLLQPYNEVLFELEQWQQLDTNYHLALSMAERLYGREDPRSIAAATTLASWKIRAWQAGVFRPRGDRSIQEAAEIYRQLLRDMEERGNDNPALRASWLSARGLAYFYSARHVANIPVHEFQRTASPNASFQQCVPLVLSVDGAQPSANACHANQNLDPEFHASQQREKNNQVRRHLGNMRQSFQLAIEAVNADPRATLEQKVQAVLNLGDANLLAEDYQRARSQYALAWEMLSQDPEDQALRQRLMGQAMPALKDIFDTLPFDSHLQGTAPLGTVAFDVTARGEIENINIGGSEAALSRENIGEIAIKLDQTVFRPRIEAGRPVASRLQIAAGEL
jgi:hypothetical protein